MLEREVQELKEAVAGGNYMHILEEAADVENFLVAIVHREIAKYRGRK